MTTQNLIDTLRQGSAITPKLVRKIVSALERALSTEAALHQVVIEHQQLQSRIRGKVMFTSEECAYLEDAMRKLATCEGLLLRVESAINESVSGVRRVAITEWTALLTEMQAAAAPTHPVGADLCVCPVFQGAHTGAPLQSSDVEVRP